MFADGNLQRPAQHAAVDELLDLVHGGIHAVERIGETEPGIQAENTAVLLDSLLYPLAFADGTRHRLLAPDILAGARGIGRHDAVPVRRRGDMHDVHIGIVNQVAVIVIGGDFLTGQLQTGIEMVPVHIADGHQPGSGIAVMSAAHTADTDDTFGELVAGCGVSRSAEHMARDHGQRCRSQQALFQEVSPFHLFEFKLVFC